MRTRLAEHVAALVVVHSSRATAHRCAPQNNPDTTSGGMRPGELRAVGSILVEEKVQRGIHHTTRGGLEGINRSVLKLGAPAHQQWRHKTHNRQSADFVDPASDLLVVVLHLDLLRLSQSRALWHVPCSSAHEEPARFHGLRQHMAYHPREQKQQPPRDGVHRGRRILVLAFRGHR